jgi:hypothetical protein
MKKHIKSQAALAAVFLASLLGCNGPASPPRCPDNCCPCHDPACVCPQQGDDYKIKCTTPPSK